jgi:DNA polymerase (family 10)
LLADRLRIRSLPGLEKAARAHKVRELPGFGATTEEKILRDLEGHRATERRTLRATAAQYAETLLAHLRSLKGVKQAELAGSFRRARETVGDLDILVTCAPRTPVMERFTGYDEVAEVLSRGPTKASVRLRSGIQVDLRVLEDRAYGAALHYFTGSKAHNIAVRHMGQERGLKINEYGVWRGTRWVSGRREQDVFKAVGLPWIPPELRENRGEIEAAHAGKLPDLVTLDDIRGDLQSHTTDSDGRDSLEAMARAADALGYEYLAVTDHTTAIAIVGGMDGAGFRRQMKRIEKLNGELEHLRILAGAEVDILGDGRLDLDDDTLAALDIVLVSMHSGLRMAPREQTRRVVRALSHKSVDIFAHPTGRLIGERRGAEFDLGDVLKAAKDHGVMVEVNAQPSRLDLDDVSCRAAVEMGVMVTLGTDAHAVDELRFMRWGVDQVRRGWAGKEDVANTRSLGKLLRLLHGSR